MQYDPIQREARQAPLLNGLFDFGGLVWLFGSAILGALAIIFAPRASARAVELGRQQPLLTFGVGLLALCTVSFAARSLVKAYRGLVALDRRGSTG